MRATESYPIIDNDHDFDDEKYNAVRVETSSGSVGSSIVRQLLVH